MRFPDGRVPEPLDGNRPLQLAPEGIVVNRPGQGAQVQETEFETDELRHGLSSLMLDRGSQYRKAGSANDEIVAGNQDVRADELGFRIYPDSNRDHMGEQTTNWLRPQILRNPPDSCCERCARSPALGLTVAYVRARVIDNPIRMLSGPLTAPL